MSNKILVATDFSPTADHALTIAVGLARQLGRAIEIVHAEQSRSYVVPPPLDLMAFTPDVNRLARAEEALAERVRRVQAAGAEAEALMLSGVPHEAIALRAEEIDAAFIVVGSHGTSALMHALIGSVADRIVRTARRPVLVVPRPARP